MSSVVSATEKSFHVPSWLIRVRLRDTGRAKSLRKGEKGGVGESSVREEKRESRMDSNASALSFLVNTVRHAPIYDESIVRSRNCAVCHDKSSLRLSVRILIVAISLLVSVRFLLRLDQSTSSSSKVIGISAANLILFSRNTLGVRALIFTNDLALISRAAHELLVP